MDRTQLYSDIASRTGGDVYFGVVGPVRTGKSTFIKRFMDLLVLPGMEDEFARARLTDELPQSGAGRTIMTTQPRFVPNEAAEISLGEAASVRIRMVDCVGYMVPGAAGHTEGDAPRMVRTPWFDVDIPFEEAAEIGTRKVITDHATIGVVVTTDGSIADIPRENYVPAEARVIAEMREQGKPFIVLLNTRTPEAPAAEALAEELRQKYGVTVQVIDALHMDVMDVHDLLQSALMEFPLRSIHVRLPGWLSALGGEHPLNERILTPVRETLGQLNRMRDYPALLSALAGVEGFEDAVLQSVRPGQGEVELEMRPAAGMFYSVLSETCGFAIRDDAHLIESLRTFAEAKREYDRLAGALRAAEATGYGMVPPAMEEMELMEPELMQQGGRFGVKLRARATGLHVIRVDMDAQIAPLVGTEAESAAFLARLQEAYADEPERVWRTEIFGSPLYDLVRENMAGKVNRLPEAVQQRLQHTIGRMVNEGCSGLICILL